MGVLHMEIADLGLRSARYNCTSSHLTSNTVTLSFYFIMLFSVVLYEYYIHYLLTHLAG